MGRDATATKRRVLDKAQECIGRTNQCLIDVQALATAHNALTTQVEADIAELKTRASAASAWCDEQLRTNARLEYLEATFLRFRRRLTFWQRLTGLLFGQRPHGEHRWELSPDGGDEQ